MTVRSIWAHLDRRVLVVFGLLALATIGLAGRLAQLQILDRDRYVAHGEEQRLNTSPLAGTRGDILDRNRDELAISLPQPTIWADPALIPDPGAAARAMAPVVGKSEAEVLAMLTNADRFAYVERSATTDMADAIEDLELAGVFVGSEPRRFHPGGPDLARSVLGEVGYDQVALNGVELQWDDELADTPGELTAETSIDGRTIPSGAREVRPATDGHDLITTLDRAVQFEVEQQLLAHVDAHCAQGGTVVVMRPASGEVLAMASVVRGEDGDAYITSDNRAVTWAYEPASVMKAVTFAALLDAGLTTVDSTRWVPDTITVYDDEFSDWPLYGHLEMTPADVLVRSSNTGTITWAGDLGSDALHAYLKRFGFGQTSALDLPWESPGILPPHEEWTGTSLATISLGQGIAVTPLQMLSAYNVLANGGIHVAPRLVTGMVDAEGVETTTPVVPPVRIISDRAAVDVTAMLAEVAERGTATRAAVPGYTVAAKTGTARKVTENGTYQDAFGAFHYITTVAGFFPAERPEISMITILDEPCGPGDIFASRTTAPLFGELASWIIRHYQIAPPTEATLRELPSLAPAVLESTPGSPVDGTSPEGETGP